MKTKSKTLRYLVELASASPNSMSCRVVLAHTKYSLLHGYFLLSICFPVCSGKIKCTDPNGGGLASQSKQTLPSVTVAKN